MMYQLQIFHFFNIWDFMKLFSSISRSKEGISSTTFSFYVRGQMSYQSYYLVNTYWLFKKYQNPFTKYFISFHIHWWYPFYFSVAPLKIMIISKGSSYFMEILKVLLSMFKSHVLFIIVWILIFLSNPWLSFLLNSNFGHMLYYLHDYIRRCKMCNVE